MQTLPKLFSRKQIILPVFLLFAVCFSPLRAQPAAGIRNILVIGDSHLKGYFGEFLHKKLHEYGKYDILSFGLGGAGSKHFTMPLKNFCCGYKIRITCAGDSLGEKENVPVLERSDRLTALPIARKYGSTLRGVLDYWQPDAIIIALGSNYVNAHQQLIDIVDSYRPGMLYVWVGPFLRQNVAIRYKAIEKVVKENGQGFLVRSDDIIGHDTLSSAHFTGREAKRWAHAVAGRIEPILCTRFEAVDSLSR